MRASPLRRSYVLAALFGSALFTLSCGGGDSGNPTPTPTDVVVTPGTDTLVSVGQTRTFSAAVLDANGDPIDGKTVTWSSTAPSVLSIDAATGLATAHANGAAQVHATVGALQGSANVVVVQLVASVTVTPGNVAFTAVGDTARFTAVAKDAGGTPVVGVQVLWSVSDNTVATIDTLGLARSKGPGNALVSAQAQTHAGYAAIGVAPGVASLAILGAPTTAVAGDPMTTALQVELRDANGNRVMNASLPVTVTAAEDAGANTLRGTTTLITDQGRASFTGLWFEHTPHDRLMVTAGVLPVAYSAPITISPAAPARIQFDNNFEPTEVAGVPIGLVARVRDRFGNLVTSYNGLVTATLAQGPDGGTLFGAYSIPADSGVAAFTTLNIHVATGPWRITAFLPGIPTARDTTPTFAVLAGPASSFALQHLGFVGVSFSFSDTTVVHVTDAFGNPASSDSLGDALVVHVEAAGWPYTAYPTKAQAMVNYADAPLIGGNAEFMIALRRPGRTRLVFSMSGFTPDTTDEIVPTLPHPGVFPVSSTLQSGVILTDRASCMLDYITLCAGANDHGLLGTDSTLVPEDSVWTPTDSTLGGAPSGGDGGDRHACAAASDFYTGVFHVACWGDNTEGQLGGGSLGGSSFIPITVEGVTSTAAPDIAAGGAHSCAIFDGAAACWGRNDFGQLGIGIAGASHGNALAVYGAHTFTQISAGGRHTCAIDDSQKLWCWGANDFGQLGNDDSTGTPTASPVAVRPDLDFVSVAAGEDFTCGGVPGSGFMVVYCWGRNDNMILGPGTEGTTQLGSPLEAQLFTGASEIFAGAGYACASIPGGFGPHVQCWGANDHGQLGRGTTGAPDGVAAAPTPVGGAVPDIELPILGRTHACAVTKEDSAFKRYLVCWGDNSYGRMGIGRTGGDEPTPIYLQGQY